MSSDLFIKFKVLSFIKSPFLRTSIACLGKMRGNVCLRKFFWDGKSNFKDNLNVCFRVCARGGTIEFRSHVCYSPTGNGILFKWKFLDFTPTVLACNI